MSWCEDDCILEGEDGYEGPESDWYDPAETHPGILLIIEMIFRNGRLGVKSVVCLSSVNRASLGLFKHLCDNPCAVEERTAGRIIRSGMVGRWRHGEHVIDEWANSRSKTVSVYRMGRVIKHKRMYINIEPAANGMFRAEYTEVKPLHNWFSIHSFIYCGALERCASVEEARALIQASAVSYQCAVGCCAPITVMPDIYDMWSYNAHDGSKLWFGTDDLWFGPNALLGACAERIKAYRKIMRAMAGWR